MELGLLASWTADARECISSLESQALAPSARSETIADFWRRVLHPDDLPETLLLWSQSSTAGDVFDARHRMRLASGEYVRARSRVRVRRDDQGAIAGWICAIQDIDGGASSTEWTALKAIYNDAPIGLCVLSPDLRWLNINKQLAAINGFPVSEHIGRRVHDLLPALAGEVERIRDQIMATGSLVHAPEITGETPQMPGVQRTWDESWTPVFDDSGAIVAINVAAREVTEERRLQQSLRDSEERFRLLAENAPSVVYIVDVLQRRLEYISPMYERIWGASREKVLGDLAYWMEMLHPDDRQAVMEARTRLYESGELERFEYRIIRASDGQIRHISDVAAPVRDASGCMVRIVGVANDVTDQRFADDRRQLIVEELAHRLKNTISTVLAIARMTIGQATSRTVLADFENRVMASFRAQSFLIRGDADRASVEDVARNALSAFLRKRARWRYKGRTWSCRRASPTR